MEGFTVKILRDYLNSLEDKDDYTIEDIKNMKNGICISPIVQIRICENTK